MNPTTTFADLLVGTIWCDHDGDKAIVVERDDTEATLAYKQPSGSWSTYAMRAVGEDTYEIAKFERWRTKADFTVYLGVDDNGNYSNYAHYSAADTAIWDAAIKVTRADGVLAVEEVKA